MKVLLTALVSIVLIVGVAWAESYKANTFSLATTAPGVMTRGIGNAKQSPVISSWVKWSA